MLFSSLGMLVAVLTKNELVYAFTYSSVQDVYAHDSQNPAEDPDPANRAESGASHYHGSLTDKGTMTVRLLRQQPDGGLVLTIAEQGENVRRAPPAECVAYSNTKVFCDPKTVYSEEYTLLRFLGRDFLDASQVDKNHHWAITQESGGIDVHADYAVVSDNGGKMQITETRRIQQPGGGSLTTDIQSKIAYDDTQSLPTSVDEHVTQRHDNGVAGTTTTIYQTTLRLIESNSVATPESGTQ